MISWCAFFVSSRRRHTRYWRDWSSDVCSSDLRWLESDLDYVRIHMNGHAPLVNAMLGEMEKLLGDGFLRIHRSTIVRKDKVRAIRRGRFSVPVLELDDGRCLPVGRKYREAVGSAFGLRSE